MVLPRREGKATGTGTITDPKTYVNIYNFIFILLLHHTYASTCAVHRESERHRNRQIVYEKLILLSLVIYRHLQYRDSMTLDDGVADELEGIWKGVVETSRCYHSIYLAMQRKIMKTLTTAGVPTKIPTELLPNT